MCCFIDLFWFAYVTYHGRTTPHMPICRKGLACVEQELASLSTFSNEFCWYPSPKIHWHISLTFDWQPNIINPKYTPVWAITSTYSKAIGNIGGTGQQRSVAQNPILVPIVKFSWGGVGYYLYLHNLLPLSF
jgi:hypothetical protein